MTRHQIRPMTPAIDTTQALRCRDATRTKGFIESRKHVRMAVRRLEQTLAEHDLFVDARASPQSRAKFNRIVGLAARLGLAVDAWSAA